MSLNITNVAVNYFEDVTKVTVEVYEMRGSIERLTDKLLITLQGKYQQVDDVLLDIIGKEMIKNGFEYAPTIN
jgi:hypothetical protein